MAKQKFNPLWSDLDKINHLQTKIIKASIAYYEHGYSFMSDTDFDDISFQLVGLQRVCKDVHLSRFWYMMYDFDGSTGFDLYNRLTEEDKEWLTWVVSREMAAHEGFYRLLSLKLSKEPEPKKVVEPVKKKKRGRLF